MTNGEAPPVKAKAKPKPPPDKNAAPSDPDRIAALRKSVQAGLLELDPVAQAKFMGNFKMKGIADLAEITDGNLLVDMSAELKGL
jgi:hypothetical protein